MAPTLYRKGSLSYNNKVLPDAPISYILGWFKNNIPEFGGGNKYADVNSRCLIVKAGTGSGKSTAMIVEIFRLWRAKNTPKNTTYSGKTVICCQPKVLTAISIATSISQSSWAPDMVYPDVIGYQTGSGGTNRPRSGLVYATYGVLSAQLLSLDDASIMSMYSVIIIDEAHERQPENDILLMMMRNFYVRNKGNKNLPFIIITSATFDPYKYAEYFDVTSNNIFIVEGSTFPIITVYPDRDYDNYFQAAADTVHEIISKNVDDEPGKWDILIFVPSPAQMREIVELIKDDVIILTLTSDKVAAGDEDIELAQLDYEKLQIKKRRVILSTVVAETGLTLNSLKYVIDAGFSITQEYYPEAFGLTVRPTTESRILQRRGRVGRVFGPGYFYPLYTESTRAMLQQQNFPDLFIRDYSDSHLIVVKEQLRQNKALKRPEIFKVEEMTLLDSPPVENFINANVKAHKLGFLITDQEGCRFTKSGTLASKFLRMKMECIRMALTSYIYPCSMYDIITLSSILLMKYSLEDFMSPKTKKVEYLGLPPDAKPLSKLNKTIFGGGLDIDPDHKFYYQTKLLLSNHFLEIMLLFDEFEKHIDDIDACEKWCEEAGLDMKSMFDLLVFRSKYVSEFKMFDIERNDHMRLCKQDFAGSIEIVKNITYCMQEGFKLNVLINDHDNVYTSFYGDKIEVKPMLPSKCIDRMIACNLIGDYKQPKKIYYNYLKLEEIRGTMSYKITCPSYF